LERATEGLSKTLEGNLPEEIDEIDQFKRSLRDKSRYCDERSKLLIDHVFEGYENDIWIYKEMA